MEQCSHCNGGKYLPDNGRCNYCGFDNHKTWLALDETDGVEVLAALELARDFYALARIQPMADHYGMLHQRLCEEAGS